MRTRTAQILVWSALVCLAATPARAQYGAGKMADPATGETYHVEVSGDFWNPNPDLVITSEALGIVGSQIDFVRDLGIVQSKFRQLKIVLRPGRKHKFRVDYLPMSYSATSTVHREFIFNGIKYAINLPVSTELSWKTWHLGYEYDFVYTDRGFVGVVLQAKATDIQASIQASALGREFARAQAPLPAIGGIGRIYVVPNISITGELDFFKIPDNIDERYQAHYWDFDLYGTVNFNDYVGAQIGYRRIDLGYVFEDDHGNFKAKGLYFSGVVRY